MPTEIIDGRWYSTDTAEFVSANEYASLHRKRNGEYFMCEGEDIRPVTYDCAEDWARSCARPEDYERHFGEPPEGAKAAMSLYGVDARAKALVYREARRTGRPVGEVVSECILAKLG